MFNSPGKHKCVSFHSILMVALTTYLDRSVTMSSSPKRRIHTEEAPVLTDLHISKRCRTSEGLPATPRDPLKQLDKNLQTTPSTPSSAAATQKSLSVPGSPALKGIYHFDGLSLDISPAKRGPSLDSYLSHRLIGRPVALKEPGPVIPSSAMNTNGSPNRGMSPPRKRLFDIFVDSEPDIENRSPSRKSPAKITENMVYELHKTMSAAIDPPKENIAPQPSPRNPYRQSSARSSSRSPLKRASLQDLDIKQYPGYITTSSLSLPSVLQSKWYTSRIENVLHASATGTVPSFASPPRRRPTASEIEHYVSGLTKKRSPLNHAKQIVFEPTPFTIYEDLNEYDNLHEPLSEIDFEGLEDKENLVDSDTEMKSPN